MDLRELIRDELDGCLFSVLFNQQGRAFAGYYYGEGDSPYYCLLYTSRITVEGYKVGYCYREKPDGGWDSGWRFTAGDESEAYMDDPNNAGIYKLNTICNDDPDIDVYKRQAQGTYKGEQVLDAEQITRHKLYIYTREENIGFDRRLSLIHI